MTKLEKLLAELCPNEVKYKKLQYLAEISTGSSNTNEAIENGKYPFFVRSQELLYKDEYEFDETAIITAGDGVGVGKVLHFYTGKYYEGGSLIEADAPLEKIPVFVREGSILPFSDDISYADEDGGRVGRIRVYEGCDCSFKIYFDKGDGYGYEAGEYSILELKYSEENQQLAISKTGDYPVDESFDVEFIGK